MAKLIRAYQSDDGSLHLTEAEAVKADAAYWKERALNPPPRRHETDYTEPQSGYGSSGGGGA